MGSYAQSPAQLASEIDRNHSQAPVRRLFLVSRKLDMLMPTRNVPVGASSELTVEEPPMAAPTLKCSVEICSGGCDISR